MAEPEKGKEKNKGYLDINGTKFMFENEKPKEDKSAEKLKTEIYCICMVVIGILLLLSIFNPSSGTAGKAMNNILFVFFGKASYTLPFIVIIFGIYFFTKKEKIKTNNILYVIFMFIVLTALFHVLGIKAEEIKEMDSSRFFYTVKIGTEMSNGGYLGSFLGTVLLFIFGKIEAVVFIVAVLLILFIMITGKSFMGFLLFAWMWIFNKIKTQINKVIYHVPDKEELVEEPNSESSGPKPKKSGFLRNNKLFKYIMNGFEDEDYDEYYEEIYEESEDEKEPENKEQTLVEHTEIYEEEVKELLEIPKDIKTDNPESNSTYEEDPFDDFLLPNEFKKTTSKPINQELKADEIKETAPTYNLPKEESEDIILTPLPIKARKVEYKCPSIELLNKTTASFSRISEAKAVEVSQKLVKTLKSFGVEVSVVGVKSGPTVTRYELVPGEGVKVSKISSLADDIALNLAAQGIRIEAPIPGKSAVGIEVPNKDANPVYLREVIDSYEFRKFPSKLAFAIGKDIEGGVVISDIAKMPHLLIAGATGSGKSVCINTLITSILYKASPEEVKLLMIDPKVVELSVYNDIPHLMIPVVTDPKKASSALNWAVNEMISRYNKFSESGVRDLKGYNEHKKSEGEPPLPQIVIIIDELADLMMASPNEVENYICRLAQMARAAGMHLIIATQRPSVDVITGVIKANIPSRLAFSVSSGTDSRTILDSVGAEKLLGRGDMLFYPSGASKPQRLQGAFISDKEVERIVEFLKTQKTEEYDEGLIEEINSSKKTMDTGEDSDELMEEVIDFIIEKGKASGSLIQRQFRTGYNRGARIIDELEAKGVVGPEDGSKPRKVLMTKAQWETFKAKKNKSEL